MTSALFKHLLQRKRQRVSKDPLPPFSLSSEMIALEGNNDNTNELTTTKRMIEKQQLLQRGEEQQEHEEEEQSLLTPSSQMEDRLRKRLYNDEESQDNNDNDDVPVTTTNTLATTTVNYRTVTATPSNTTAKTTTATIVQWQLEQFQAREASLQAQYEKSLEQLHQQHQLALGEMQRMCDQMRHEYSIKLQEEVVRANNCKNQFDTLKIRYKKWYKELEGWITTMNVKTTLNPATTPIDQTMICKCCKMVKSNNDSSNNTIMMRGTPPPVILEIHNENDPISTQRPSPSPTVLLTHSKQLPTADQSKVERIIHSNNSINNNSHCKPFKDSTNIIPPKTTNTAVTPSPYWGIKSKHKHQHRQMQQQENRRILSQNDEENSQTQWDGPTFMETSDLLRDASRTIATNNKDIMTQQGADTPTRHTAIDESQALLDSFQPMDSKNLSHKTRTIARKAPTKKRIAPWTLAGISRNFVHESTPAATYAKPTASPDHYHQHQNMTIMKSNPPLTNYHRSSSLERLTSAKGTGRNEATARHDHNHDGSTAKREDDDFAPISAPPTNKKPPGFVYHDVVRNKVERQSMPGHSCQECKAFWDTVCDDGTVFERKHFEDCSRHRARHSPPSTPDGFWELSFMDEIKARRDEKS